MGTTSMSSKSTSKFVGVSSDMRSILSEVKEIDPNSLPVTMNTFREFRTGTSYHGDWNELGMTGYGEFTYPHGVIYRGTFKNGEFHGKGLLIYPMGQIIHGVWEEGELLSWTYEFPDGLFYKQPWKYCEIPDRRYYITQQNGLEAVCNENLTAVIPPRPIPSDCYDCGEGIFVPGLASTISAYHKNKILRVPVENQEIWIKEHCRRGKVGTIGLRRDLYETWTSGRKSRSGKDVRMVHKDKT